MADDNTQDAPAEDSAVEETPTEEVQSEEQTETTETSSAAEETSSESQNNETAASPDDSAEKTASADKGKSESSNKKAVSKELEGIIEKIEKLSVLELADLVHALEDRFGVSAAAPMAAAQPAAPAGGEAAEEQTTFNVILTSAGANKIGAIKAVREIVPTLGLKEAKDLVESAPKPVLEGVNKETANEAKTKLTAAGATVDLQ